MNKRRIVIHYGKGYVLDPLIFKDIPTRELDHLICSMGKARRSGLFAASNTAFHTVHSQDYISHGKGWRWACNMVGARPDVHF